MQMRQFCRGSLAYPLPRPPCADRSSSARGAAVGLAARGCRPSWREVALAGWPVTSPARAAVEPGRAAVEPARAARPGGPQDPGGATAGQHPARRSLPRAAQAGAYPDRRPVSRALAERARHSSAGPIPVMPGRPAVGPSCSRLFVIDNRRTARSYMSSRPGQASPALLRRVSPHDDH